MDAPKHWTDYRVDELSSLSRTFFTNAQTKKSNTNPLLLLDILEFCLGARRFLELARYIDNRKKHIFKDYQKPFSYKKILQARKQALEDRIEVLRAMKADGHDISGLEEQYGVKV